MVSVIMNSHNVILTTALAVSGAVIILSLSRICNFPTIFHHLNSHPSKPISSSLPSCLSSEGQRREKKTKIKKKVKFVDNIKDERGKVDRKRRNEKHDSHTNGGKIPEFLELPANQAALYRGILRDRIHRNECFL